MLAQPGNEFSNDKEWLYELKYDGYRVIAEVVRGKVELLSRNGMHFTKLYEPLSEELKFVKEQVVLDGEVVIENKKGVSDFQLLQNYNSTRKGKLKYYVFDILFLNGYALTGFTLLERKELLGEFFKKYHFKNIFNSPWQIGDGKKLFKTLISKGHEGIIAKQTESNYFPGKRTSSWIKIKEPTSQEVVICGYTLPQNSRKYFGSLILGVYDESELKYIGNCGSGFTEASLEELHTKFQKLKTNQCPFEFIPKMMGQKGKPIWLKPELVCHVKFIAWTADQRLRHPVFMGLRIDKEPDEVINENKELNSVMKPTIENEKIISVSGKKVKCTNLTKVYWPDEGYTKADLIEYYKRMSKFILPYLKNRPQSLNRHPNGIKGNSFYQKDMEVKQLPEWAQTAKLYSKSNKSYIDYLICNDAATLIYMANLGCIEINPWHSRIQYPDQPDYLMLDLDPGEIEFIEVINTALVIKEICDEIKIDCYCKTSGASGLHIYIPLAAKYIYEEARTFAEIIAVLTHQRLPGPTSIERSVAKRKNKIYIDFLQNSKGQTIAAPYSVRPRPLATVSTPLKWKEVNSKLTPQLFTINNIEERLLKIGDLWKPVLKKGINLTNAIKAIEKL
jgi:bifunctional non-homologous end joining protein LigD